MPRPDAANGRAQQGDMFDQQRAPPVGEIDREEKGTAGNKVSSVVCHPKPNRGVRWVSRSSTHPTAKFSVAEYLALGERCGREGGGEVG